MPEPYNYTIDLPRPPADTMLQDIMGIQQLKGLRQQQEIQAKQAAFQEQMQPLEMQKARSALAAQQSAMASAEQSRRQNEILFKQGQEDRTRGMEQQAIAQARQNELFGKLSALPPDAPMSAIIPIANELALVKPESAKQVMANYENAPKQFQKASETTLVSALNQLNANDVAGAKKTYSEFATAIENSMGKNPELKALADAAKVQVAALNFPNEEGVNIAKASGIQLLSLVNPQAVNAFVGAQETQARTKTELAKLTPGGKEMSDKQLADINVLTSEAGKIRTNVAGLTDSVDDLLKFAEQFPKEFKSGGQAALQNIMSSISGDTTRAQNLRASIEPYTKAQWIAKASGLKGSLSDKESAMLQKGAPKVETAGPAELLNWARLAQKVELADANQKDFDAAWQQNVRSLQLKSPVEFEVSGVVVKPGDSYGKVLTKINAQNRKKNDEEIQADAARLKRIQEAEKLGRTPIPNMYNLGGAPQQPRPASAPKMRLISIE